MKKVFVTLVAIVCSMASFAQTENTATEIIDYREADGRIIVKTLVNGVEGDFLLDMAGHNAILADKLEKYKIDVNVLSSFSGYTNYLYKNVAVGVVHKMGSVSVGNNAFGNEVKFFVLTDEPYLRQLGVDGVIGSFIFNGVVLTIDTNRKKITTTAPFRPPYMKLDGRANMTSLNGSALELILNINGVDCPVVLDTWNRGVVTLNEADFAKLSTGKTVTDNAIISLGYGKDLKAEKQMKADVSFIKSNMNGLLIAENKSLPRSVAGLGLLEKGVVSLDFAKGKIYFQEHDKVVIDESSMKPKAVVIEAGKLNPITRDYFLENIFDYKKGSKFMSKYDKLIVMDFWATWCGPCMKLMPQMEALAAKYKDKVVFMKVNADKERELCNIYGVSALPTILYILPGGKPIFEIGVTADKIDAKIKELLK